MGGLHWPSSVQRIAGQRHCGLSLNWRPQKRANAKNPEYSSVTWPITVPQTGRHKLYGTRNSDSSRASNAKYTITTGPNQHTSIQNQRLNGGQWNLLGEYTSDIADNANGQNNVSLSAEPIAI